MVAVNRYGAAFLLFACGAVVGFSVAPRRLDPVVSPTQEGISYGPSEEIRPPYEPTRSVVTPTATCEEAEAVARSKSEELRFCTDLLGAQLVSLIGYPIDWPVNIPADYSADAVAMEVEAASQTCPGAKSEHVILDCEEFPCMLLQYIPEESPASFGLFGCADWPFIVTRSRSVVLSDGGRIKATPVVPNTPWCEGELCANYDKRWEFRAVSGLEAAREVWDPSSGGP